MSPDRPPGQEEALTAREGGFALYVHWPFCKAKCPYCDFNSHVRGTVDHRRWQQALLREIDALGARLEPQRLRSIFFGGGTPSLMSPRTVAAVVERATTIWPAEDGLEITLEANPTSVEAERFAGFKTAGVNRVSLGVQALEDLDLKALGREHSSAEALAAVELASRLFERWSIDLIYARPQQNLAAWEAELRRALAWVGDHLSVYQLTIEPRTPFHAFVRTGALRMPDADLQADLYELTQALLEAEGLPAYEISNHARPGGESRHNLVYWTYGHYAGIGPGAHGSIHLDGRRVTTSAERVPERWLARIESGQAGWDREWPLDPSEQLIEALMMGLRLRHGISVAGLEALGGAPLANLVSVAGFAQLQRAGFLVLQAGRLQATAAGRLRLNGLLAMLLNERRDAGTSCGRSGSHEQLGVEAVRPLGEQGRLALQSGLEKYLAPPKGAKMV